MEPGADLDDSDALAADSIGRRFVLFANVAGATSVAVGFTSLLGWALHVRVLSSFVPGASTMKPNTSVCLVLAGVALGLVAGRTHRARSRLLASIVAVVGALTVLEYILGRPLGIDRILFSHAFASDTSATPGRMAPSTAAAMLLIGSALVLRSGARRWATRATEIAALSAVFVGFIAGLGYAFGAPALYRLALYSSMALPTAIMVIALGLGTVFARPGQGMMALMTTDSAGGRLVRQLIPITVAVEIIVGAISLILQRSGLYGNEFGLAIVVAAAAMVIAAAAWNTASRLHVLDTDRADLLVNLEQRVDARTVELHATYLALAEATQLFHSAFEDAPIGFVISSLDGVYERVNKAMCSITGYAEVELVGRNGMHMTHLDDYARDLAGVEGMRDGSLLEFLNEKRYVRSDGEVIWVSIHASLLPEPDGPPRHIIAQVVDVTDRHRVEEALSAANVELQHANELKDHFVAVTTHELRSPLTTIIGFTELLRDGGDAIPEPKRRDYIERIERQGQRLNGLVSDLLTLSTIDAGGLHVEELPVVARAAIDEAVAAFGGVDSVVCEPELIVFADPDRLQQILINLLTNAQKYGAHPISVNASLVAGERIAIVIADRGEGVPDDFVPYLFETFTQAGTGRTRRTKGSGLGLAIVHRLALAQRGEAFYEPNPGGGSRFGVVLQSASVGRVPDSSKVPIGVSHVD